MGYQLMLPDITQSTLKIVVDDSTLFRGLWRVAIKERETMNIGLRMKDGSEMIVILNPSAIATMALAPTEDETNADLKIARIT
jgi:hypothetical protein